MTLPTAARGRALLAAGEQGPSTAPTTIFLHGAGVSRWMWRGQLAAVPDLHCILPDLPGHGQSRSVAWESIPAAAAQIADLIRNRAHGGRANVVGLSLGGVIGLQLVADHPDVVARAMLTGVLGAGLPGAKAYAILTAAFMPLARWRPMIALSARTLKVPAADLEAMAEELRRLDSRVVSQTLLDVAAFRPPVVLAHRAHPVLLVAGSREHQGIRATVRTVLDRLPQGVGGLVPKGLHTWNWQFPELFNRMLREWLIDERAPTGLLRA